MAMVCLQHSHTYTETQLHTNHWTINGDSAKSHKALVNYSPYEDDESLGKGRYAERAVWCVSSRGRTKLMLCVCVQFHKRQMFSQWLFCGLEHDSPALLLLYYVLQFSLSMPVCVCVHYICLRLCVVINMFHSHLSPRQCAHT